jgi:tetratricopeptide (TPR) repeat protein
VKGELEMHTKSYVLKVSFALVVFLAITTLCFSEDGRMPKAEELLGQGKYDEAILILKDVIHTNPEDALAFLRLAQAYHWKKNFEEALGYYKRATELDRKYRLAVIPLLVDLDKYRDIIELVGPEFEQGALRNPSILGSLAYAYRKTANKEKAEAAIKVVRETEYEKAGEKDYRLYVLAYDALWHDDKSLSKEYLREIKDIRFLEYATTDKWFMKLWADPEFVEITKRK